MPYVSKRTPAERFWRNVDVIDDADSCWRWTRHLDFDGYGSFYVGPNQPAQRASRYAWFLATGEAAGDLCVCHHCDNPSCVRPSHLFLGTRSDNMRDAVAKGRHKHAVIRGEAHANAKVTTGDVAAIRAMRAAGTTLKTLSGAFGIGMSQVGRICRHESWATS